MKANYVSAEISIVRFEDVITASNGVINTPYALDPGD